ncbi:MAG: SAM-dependent methyltransferase [Pseudomonadota bacterium]
MNATATSNHKSALEERLISLIQANAPISIADFMADALLHPHDGYYTSKAPIGARGDFTTAPEISQIFGELIGLWLVQSWIELGAPKPFHLIELGPGRGVLMADILRAAALRPDFLNAAQIHLVELSGRLRHEQQKRLKKITGLSDFQPAVQWSDTIDDIDAGPSLIIANEFLDCLPIRQFVRTDIGWRERLVGVHENKNELCFELSATPPLSTIPLPDKDEVAVGEIFEWSEAQEFAIRQLTARLHTEKGSALIIDYGHIQSGIGDTLQAVRKHASWPILAAPGEADITSHVNFDRLSKIGFETGTAVFGPISQGVFLDRLGLAIRVERLCAGKSEATADEIRSGAFRIAATSEMGEIFKAFCLSSPGLKAPAGFHVP